MKLFGVISVYGLLIVCAMALGVVLVHFEEKRKGMPKDTALDIALWVIPAAIIGARLYYVAFEWEQYRNNLISILYVWNGGLATYGGVIGGVIGGLLLCKVKKLSFLKVADMVAPVLILGQAIGRWGNFANQEAFGTLITDPAWQWFPAGVFVQGEWHMATFFYESMWDLLGFILLYFGLRKRATKDGDVFAGYFIWYGIGRSVIEGFRTDSLYVPGTGIRVSQVLSIVLVLGGILYFVFRHGICPRLKHEAKK